MPPRLSNRLTQTKRLNNTIALESPVPLITYYY
jgi:hypothetical protein